VRPNLNELKKLQQKMAKIQEELGNETVEASVGGGAVTVTMNGHQRLVGVKISPEAIDPDDPSILEDLILTAVNDAIAKSQDLMTKRMGALTGGLKIPGLM
jgi:DNA-binding YbaB/EbfC family protein